MKQKEKNIQKFGGHLELFYGKNGPKHVPSVKRLDKSTESKCFTIYN